MNKILIPSSFWVMLRNMLKSDTKITFRFMFSESGIALNDEKQQILNDITRQLIKSAGDEAELPSIYLGVLKHYKITQIEDEIKYVDNNIRINVKVTTL